MIESIRPATALFLANLDNLNQRLARAQRQISSGLKLSTASDSPGDVPQVLQAQAQVDQATQIGTNLGQVKGQVDTAESALESAVTVLERITQLATEGATVTETADSRQNIATEVAGLQQQLVGIANTSMGGSYLFGGDQDQVSPYTLNPYSSTGVASNIDWSVTGATRQALHPSGSTFPIARTAQEIFDKRDANGNPAADNVFAAVNALQVALQNGSDATWQQSAIENAVGSLQTASTHLNSELAFYGTVQNQVAGAIDDADNTKLRAQTALSAAQDADLPTAIMEMTEAQLGQQAALQAQAKMPKSSLFDYLG